MPLPKYIVQNGTLLRVKDGLEAAKTYHLILEGIRGIVRVRKNGKDCRFYNHKPRTW